MKTLFDTARWLTENAACTLMGSLCLYMHEPEILGGRPHDVDLFADGNEDNLKRIISLLGKDGFRLWSWQDRIDSSTDLSILRGRYYIRGVRDELIVDITYESDGVAYEDMKQYETIIDGIRVYDRRGLIRLLSCSDRSEHRMQMEKLLSLINH